MTDTKAPAKTPAKKAPAKPVRKEYGDLTANAEYNNALSSLMGHSVGVAISKTILACWGASDYLWEVDMVARIQKAMGMVGLDYKEYEESVEEIDFNEWPLDNYFIIDKAPWLTAIVQQAIVEQNPPEYATFPQERQQAYLSEIARLASYGA